MKMEGTLVDLYHVIKHLPTMENEEEITKLHILLLFRFLHRHRVRIREIFFEKNFEILTRKMLNSHVKCVTVIQCIYCAP